MRGGNTLNTLCEGLRGGGVWNLKKYLEIRAATRAAPAKLGFGACQLQGFMFML